MPRVLQNPRSALSWLLGALLLIWCVGMFGRGYWTPDEPREADIAWRMSWQPDKAVPLLAGEAFCEKPPLTYWLAAIPVQLIGAEAWSVRLPNLLYALITALGVGLLAARSAGRISGLVGAAAISTFLLAYQVEIWLATDAPLLACVSVALLGAYSGFYASGTGARLRGYTLMHVALAFGFLSKSAVAWMVPALAILTLSVWEKRWRELFRWELYLGLLIHAAVIGSWVWFVYVGEEGPAHLKVFFWNNLAGRFAAVDAPAELQYAAAHRNFPGKYLLELPIYLFPWTLLMIACARRAWQQRRAPLPQNRAMRFGVAASLPALVFLSLAATARNVYFAPALPGVALLVAWWTRQLQQTLDAWDVRALRATAALLLVSAAVFAAAATLIGLDAWSSLGGGVIFVLVSVSGLLAALIWALRAWAAAPREPLHSQCFLLLSYCALLVAPASQIYRQVDVWQDLASIGRAVARDTEGKPLILLSPDETTRAFVDMYGTTHVDRIDGPFEAAVERASAHAAAAPGSLILVQLPQPQRFDWRLRGLPRQSEIPGWIQTAHLEVAKSYSVPHGRRYALLKLKP